jgi:hypothetical protein
MNPIRRVRRTLARWPSPPDTGEPCARQPNGQEPHLVSRPGSDRPAGRFLQHVAAGASVAASQKMPAPTTTNSRRRTITTPRLLPHTAPLDRGARRRALGEGPRHPAAALAVRFHAGRPGHPKAASPYRPHTKATPRS